MSHSAGVLLAFLVARTERFLRNEVVVVPARLGAHRVIDHRDRHLVQHLLGSWSCDTMTEVPLNTSTGTSWDPVSVT